MGRQSGRLGGRLVGRRSGILTRKLTLMIVFHCYRYDCCCVRMYWRRRRLCIITYTVIRSFKLYFMHSGGRSSVGGPGRFDCMLCTTANLFANVPCCFDEFLFCILFRTVSFCRLLILRSVAVAPFALNFHLHRSGPPHYKKKLLSQSLLGFLNARAFKRKIDLKLSVQSNDRCFLKNQSHWAPSGRCRFFFFLLLGPSYFLNAGAF